MTSNPKEIPVRFRSSCFIVREDDSEWHEGTLINEREGTWWRVVESHYDGVIKGPRHWIVAWQNEEGIVILKRYKLIGNLEDLD